MEIGSSIAANTEAVELMQSGDGAFHGPAHRTEPAARFTAMRKVVFVNMRTLI